jgi:hypothetical protein
MTPPPVPLHPGDPGPGVARLPGPAAAPPAGPHLVWRLDWTPVIAALLIGAAVFGLIRTALIDRIEALEADLALRPPIAVVDYGSIQAALVAGASPADLQPAFAEVKSLAAAYGRDGYLVINRAALEAAPQRLVFEAEPVLVAPPPPSAASLFAPLAEPGGAERPEPSAQALPDPRMASPRPDMTPDEAAAFLRALIAGQAGAGAGGRP